MKLSSGTTGDELSDEQLDHLFMALANRTRRGMLRYLSMNGAATMSELAEPFAMSQPGASKHVRVLERGGLVNREIDGRIHRCTLDSRPLQAAGVWVAQTQAFWDSQLTALADHFTDDDQIDHQSDD